MMDDRVWPVQRFMDRPGINPMPDMRLDVIRVIPPRTVATLLGYAKHYRTQFVISQVDGNDEPLYRAWGKDSSYARVTPN